MNKHVKRNENNIKKSISNKFNVKNKRKKNGIIDCIGKQ
jgi:hypothetical protein